MDRTLELDLELGRTTTVQLPEAGDFATFYVLSMEYSGNIQFWALLAALMAAVARPVWRFHDSLRELGLHLGNLTPSARRLLMNQQGYGLGIFFDALALLPELALADCHKLIFLRDPRDMLFAAYRYSLRQSEQSASAGSGHAVAVAPASFDEYLQSPGVEQVAKRYRRLAKFRREARNVTLFRFEHALSGWASIASDLVATLDLPLDPQKAAAIAAAAAPLGDTLPWQTPAGRHASAPTALDAPMTDIVTLDARLSDVLAAFGYPLRSNPESWPGGVLMPQADGRKEALPSNGGPAQSAGEATGSRPARPLLGAIYQNDPILYNRLKPNSSTEMQVLGRRVIMDVDASGCRPVVGQPAAGEKTLAAFGCSFTFGIAVAAEETFCSLLQGMFPTWRVENHGVSAYGESHNLIQLEREIRWHQPQLVTFCWIEHHMRRNVADLNWVQITSRNSSRPVSQQPPQRQIPRAGLDSQGALAMRSTRMPRHDLLDLDFSDFSVDPFYQDLVAFRLFERAHEWVTGYGGHFFVTALQGRFSTTLAQRMAERGIPVVDADLPRTPDYLCLPDDPHPNARAHRVYAERIRDHLLNVAAAEPVGPAGPHPPGSA